jgi:hypothetical protein
MATKTRKVTTEEIYQVCDLCSGEITACNGNTIAIADNIYLVHLMPTVDGKTPCGIQAIADALAKNVAKKR